MVVCMYQPHSAADPLRQWLTPAAPAAPPQRWTDIPAEYNQWIAKRPAHGRLAREIFLGAYDRSDLDPSTPSPGGCWNLLVAFDVVVKRPILLEIRDQDPGVTAVDDNQLKTFLLPFRSSTSTEYAVYHVVEYEHGQYRTTGDALIASRRMRGRHGADQHRCPPPVRVAAGTERGPAVASGDNHLLCDAVDQGLFLAARRACPHDPIKKGVKNNLGGVDDGLHAASQSAAVRGTTGYKRHTRASRAGYYFLDERMGIMLPSPTGSMCRIRIEMVNTIAS